MDINRANLEVLFQDFKVAFSEGFNAGVESSILDTIAMVMPSTGSSVLHAWLNQIPRMQEWVGDRIVNNIESDNMTITNRKFEATIEIPREDIEDDQHGLYRPLARYLGQNAAAHPDQLCYDALVANSNWADGSAFFLNNRTYGSNTIDNLSTSALSETEFESAIETMWSYVGHNNEPLNVRPTVLLVGPSQRDTAWDICQNEFRAIVAADASSYVHGRNRNAGLVTPVVSSRLVGTYASNWYLLGEIAGIKGIVYQQRKVAELQDTRMTDDSDFVFENDKYQMGVRSRGESFLSLPHLIFGGVVA